MTREIAPAVAGMDLDDQAGLDARLIALDGTPNKGRLGANALLGVSLAVAHAAAAARGEELFVHLNRLWRTIDCGGVGRKVAPTPPTLPLPMVNMISGGLHAGGNLDIQDVLIIPVGARELQRGPGDDRRDLSRRRRGPQGDGASSRPWSATRGATALGSATTSRRSRSSSTPCVACGFEPGRDVAIAVDVASTHFFDPARGTYRLHATGDRELDAGGMIDLLAGWVERYPIVSIEDGLAEDDWDGWTALTARLGGSVQLIGDDLFATQVARLRQGIDRRAGNAVLIKLNQVGTLTETLDALRLARSHGFRTVVSARSGETEDTTIADLAVATAAGQIKIGSVARSERLAKYNRLLRIEEALGPDAPFARPFA